MSPLPHVAFCNCYSADILVGRSSPSPTPKSALLLLFPPLHSTPSRPSPPPPLSELLYVSPCITQLQLSNLLDSLTPLPPSTSLCTPVKPTCTTSMASSLSPLTRCSAARCPAATAFAHSSCASSRLMSHPASQWSFGHPQAEGLSNLTSLSVLCHGACCLMLLVST